MIVKAMERSEKALQMLFQVKISHGPSLSIIGLNEYEFCTGLAFQYAFLKKQSLLSLSPQKHAHDCCKLLKSKLISKSLEKQRNIRWIKLFPYTCLPKRNSYFGHKVFHRISPFRFKAIFCSFITDILLIMRSLSPTWHQKFHMERKSMAV